MIKQNETLSSIPPINPAEDGNWLLGVTCFEATNSVFIITDENNSSYITTLGYWSSREGSETIFKLR